MEVRQRMHGNILYMHCYFSYGGSANGLLQGRGDAGSGVHFHAVAAGFRVEERDVEVESLSLCEQNGRNVSLESLTELKSVIIC